MYIERESRVFDIFGRLTRIERGSKVEEERLKAIALQEERERQLHEARIRGARILQVPHHY